MGILYKIALDQRKEIHKKEKEWAKIMKENATPDGKMNLAGKLAEMQLMRSLENNGLFDRAVKSSSLLSAIPDKTTAKNYAMSNAKTLLINNYDPTKANNVRTYLDSSLPLQLKTEKYKNKAGAVYMGTAHEKHMEVIANVQNHLQLTTGKEPTAEDIYNAIQSGVTTAGKGITLPEIKKALKLTRKQLSGNVLIGSDAAGSAESISLEDVTNVNSKTPQQIREEKRFMQDVENEIGMIQSKEERTFLRAYYGIGQFKYAPSKTLNAAALQGGLTNYQAQKVDKDFRDRLRQKGILK